MASRRLTDGQSKDPDDGQIAFGLSSLHFPPSPSRLPRVTRNNASSGNLASFHFAYTRHVTGRLARVHIQCGTPSNLVGTYQSQSYVGHDDAEGRMWARALNGRFLFSTSRFGQTSRQ